MEKETNRGIKTRWRGAKIRRGFKTAYANIGNSLDFEYKGTKIIHPNTPDDVVQKGNILHHCVSGYVSRIANKERLILFLRQCSNENRPFYTIEVRQMRIIQVRGYGNQDLVQEVQDLIDRWKRKVLQAAIPKTT